MVLPQGPEAETLREFENQLTLFKNQSGPTRPPYLYSHA